MSFNNPQSSMASLKRKRLNSSSHKRTTNTIGSLHADRSSRIQVGNSYTEVHNGEGRQPDNECLRDLRTTDPRIDKLRIEKDKGGLVQGSYHWALEDSKFQQWAQGTQDRLLWVRGDPGKGKTMLLCGLIDDLAKSQHSLSYFFCQATDSRINNATSVLRGLIHLLAVQDTSLTRHVRNKWDHGGKSTFDPPNGWHVLCNIIEDMFHSHSKPTCLVIDALDECEDSSRPDLLWEGNLARHDTLVTLVRRCGSLLTIQQGTDTIHFVHQSAKDFLTDNKDALDGMFPSGMGEGHGRLFSRSLTAMTTPITGLRQNMYDLRNPGILSSEIKIPMPDPLAELRYSCVHWLDHFCEWMSLKQDRGEDDVKLVIVFFKDKYLCWLEALGLCGGVLEGIASIRKLEALAVHNQWEHLATLVRDAQRFVLANRQGLETAPLQVYVSALIFCPTSSWVRMKFETVIPGWVKTKPTMQPEWDACLMTLEGHNSQITTLAFSPDRKIMASSDISGIIKIWDPDTGACLNTISNTISTYHYVVYNLAFLSGKSGIDLAVTGGGRGGSSIKIWDPFNESSLRKTFTVDGWMSLSVAIITDSRTVVWANGWGTLINLDLDTGALLGTIKLPTHIIAISPDGQTFITYLDTKHGNCLQVWDWYNPRTCRLTIDDIGGDRSPSRIYVGVSPDSTTPAYWAWLPRNGG